MRAFGILGRVMVATFVVTGVAVAQVQPGGVVADRELVARFDGAVAEYLRAHRFPEIDLETICLPDGGGYGAARLDEPPAPREGEVFVPALTAVIRTRIAALELGTQKPAVRGPRAAVGDRLAAGRGGRIPRAVATVLPAIPEDLDYRLVGPDLVLLDLRTNIVIDTLREWRG